MRNARTAHILRFLVAAALALPALPARAEFVPADDPALCYSGRWADVDGEMHASGAGQRLRFMVTGAECALIARGVSTDGNLPPISIRVDGGPWTRFTAPLADQTRVPLYEDASWGPHMVEVVTSVMDGPFWSDPMWRFIVRGLDLAPGGSLAPAPWPGASAVFLGDSITAGYLDITGDHYSPAGPQSEVRLTAASLVGDWTGINTINVSVQSIGLTRPYYGTLARDFMANTFEGVPWQPDPPPLAAVVNLGTNDFVPDDEVNTAADDYLRLLRARMPDTPLFVLTPYGGAHREALRECVDALGDPAATFVDTTAESGDPWINIEAGADTTDGIHPNAAGNEKIARRLVALLGVDTSAVASLAAPADGATVAGRVPVMGTARGAGFTGAVLEFGSGDAPEEWMPVASLCVGWTDALVGVWDTRSLPPGPYTLRLTTVAESGSVEAAVHVTVLRPGDVDMDGIVTAADAAMVLKAAAGLSPLPDGREAVADVDPDPGTGARPAGDDAVTLADALAILRAMDPPMENPAPARLH